MVHCLRDQASVLHACITKRPHSTTCAANSGRESNGSTGRMLASAVPGAAHATNKAAIGNTTIRRTMRGKERRSTGRLQVMWVAANPNSCGEAGRTRKSASDGSGSAWHARGGSTTAARAGIWSHPRDAVQVREGSRIAAEQKREKRLRMGCKGFILPWGNKLGGPVLRGKGAGRILGWAEGF